jgi:hypothetical protein
VKKRIITEIELNREGRENKSAKNQSSDSKLSLRAQREKVWIN